MATVVIKGKVSLAKRDLNVLRDATPESALATMRSQGSKVSMQVVTETKPKKLGEASMPVKPGEHLDGYGA